MEVKNIIKKVVAITDSGLYEAIENDSLTELQQKEIQTLVNCVNLTISNISTNYFKLYDIVEVESSDGVIPYSKITDKPIYDIVSVKNSSGQQLFTIKSTALYTTKGKVKIKFSYFPDDIAYGNSIECFPVKVSERVVVYGVLAEYLYIKGVFDEALVWENRFKTEMQSVNRQQKNINLKKRGWH